MVDIYTLLLCVQCSETITITDGDHFLALFFLPIKLAASAAVAARFAAGFFFPPAAGFFLARPLLPVAPVPLVSRRCTSSASVVADPASLSSRSRVTRGSRC